MPCCKPASALQVVEKPGDYTEASLVGADTVCWITLVQPFDCVLHRVESLRKSVLLVSLTALSGIVKKQSVRFETLGCKFGKKTQS